MSKFVPRWAHWNAAADAEPSAPMANQQACKTSRSPFAGFAGSLDGHSEGATALADRGDTDLAASASESAQTANQQACKTSRSPFAGFAGSTESHTRPTTDGAVPVSEPAAEDDPLASMPLSEFANAGLVETIYSHLLECSILVVSDNALDKVPPDNDLPVYRASEMLRLALLRPEPRTLRTIHDVKTVFDGVISDAE